MTKDSETQSGFHPQGDDPDVLDHRALIKEQAAVWLIRISDNALAPEDVDALREWVGRSDFHRDYFVQLSQNWDDMAVLQELAVLFAVPRADTSSRARQGLVTVARKSLLPRLLPLRHHCLFAPLPCSGGSTRIGLANAYLTHRHW